jgi:hypothetical protein
MFGNWACLLQEERVVFLSFRYIHGTVISTSSRLITPCTQIRAFKLYGHAVQLDSDYLCKIYTRYLLMQLVFLILRHGRSVGIVRLRTKGHGVYSGTDRI